MHTPDQSYFFSKYPLPEVFFLQDHTVHLIIAFSGGSDPAEELVGVLDPAVYQFHYVRDRDYIAILGRCLNAVIERCQRLVTEHIVLALRIDPSLLYCGM